MERQFSLSLTYKSNKGNWETQSHDVLMADDLVSLLSQFNIIVAQLHRRIVEEEKDAVKRIFEDDIPF